MDVLIPVVNSFIVVDADGDRLMAKYYDNKPKAEQLKFEAMLHKKTKAINAKVDGKICKAFAMTVICSAEILLVDNEIIVLRSGNDCKFYVSGPVEEVLIVNILR